VIDPVGVCSTFAHSFLGRRPLIYALLPLFLAIVVAGLLATIATGSGVLTLAPVALVIWFGVAFVLALDR